MLAESCYPKYPISKDQYPKFMRLIPILGSIFPILWGQSQFRFHIYELGVNPNIPNFTPNFTWISRRPNLNIHGHHPILYQDENAPALTHLPFAIPTLFDVMTSFCDVTWRHSVTSHDVMTSHCRPGYKMLVTLTFDLWPGPSHSSERSSMPIPVPIFRSICQFVWPWER